MESRVMGNCHARFGAGENLEERVCSLRLHTPPKRLPIAIIYYDSCRNGDEKTEYIKKKYVCCAEQHCRSMGKDIFRFISASKTADR